MVERGCAFAPRKPIEGQVKCDASGKCVTTDLQTLPKPSEQVSA
jgi:hypothetical protein